MPSTSRETKEEVISDTEIPLRRHSSRVCKSTYRVQDNNYESEDDDGESHVQNRLAKPFLQDCDNDSDDEFLPTKPSHNRRLPVCQERYEVPPITSRRQPSRFHDEEDTEEEMLPTKAKSTRTRFSNNEETDQKGTRNLRKKKRWNYAKMLDVSGVSSEEGVDDWKPSQQFTQKASSRTSRGLRSKQKQNHTNRNDQSFTDSSDDNGIEDDDDDENSVNIRVSVSSRGRIRKLTAEAKAHLFHR